MLDAQQEAHRGAERCDLRESEVDENDSPGDDVEAQVRVDREDHEADAEHDMPAAEAHDLNVIEPEHHRDRAIVITKSNFVSLALEFARRHGLHDESHSMSIKSTVVLMLATEAYSLDASWARSNEGTVVHPRRLVAIAHLNKHPGDACDVSVSAALGLDEE